MLTIIVAAVKTKREGIRAVRRQADEIMRLKDQGVSPSEIVIRLGIGRASVYRVLIEQEKAAA